MSKEGDKRLCSVVGGYNIIEKGNCGECKAKEDTKKKAAEQAAEEEAKHKGH